MSSPKIVLVGAGSTVFAKNLIGDILSYPALAAATLVLFDIDRERLATSEIVAGKVAATLRASPTITATLNRRQALAGADYVISMFQVGGYRPSTVIDFEVPKKYGLPQTIADTLGIGGIMRGLRTVPVFLSMLEEMAELCPAAIHLNYVNPMAINCWAMHRASPITTVGLCHSVPQTAQELAGDIGVPVDTVDYLCAGINHNAFFLKFEQAGEDLYPRLRQVARSGKIPYRGKKDRADGGTSGLSDAVRYKVLEALGYFVTESSEHFSEYVPWFIKRERDDLIREFEVPLDEYLRRCERQLSGWTALRRELEDPSTQISVKRSGEYGATVINSLVTGEPSLIYGNVRNDDLIDNLPNGCVVEVPCDVDAGGVRPRSIGALPPQLAAVMQSNVNVQQLTVEAALTGRREHIYHAALLDPLTGSLLSIDDIQAMVDELLEAHADYLPAAFRREA